MRADRFVLEPSLSEQRTLLILASGVLAFVLAQTTVIPALSDLQNDFSASADSIAWMLTAYLLVGCVAAPIFGRLGDMFGKQRLLALSLGFFTLGSLVCATAPTLELMVAGRALQGLGGGVFPLSFGIVRDEFPEERVASGIALLGSLMTIGGGLGLPLGGALVDGLGSGSIFWVGAAMGAVAAATTYAFVPASTLRAPGRVDGAGAGILALGLCALLTGISRSADWGWGSPASVTLVAGGLAVLAGFWSFERGRHEPLVDVASLGRRPVLLAHVSTILVAVAMISPFVIVPQLAQLPEAGGLGFGLSATEAGLLLVPGSVLSMLAAPVNGRICARIGAKWPCVLSCVAVAAALTGMALWHTGLAWIVLWACLINLGLGVAFGSIPTLIVTATDEHETSEAMGTNTVMRNVGLALGAQVAGTVIASHTLTDGQPADAGFTIAFAIGAVGALGAALTVASIPGSARERRSPRRADAGRPTAVAPRRLGASDGDG